MTKRIMLINVNEPEENRIAVIDNDRLEELYIERASSLGHVGNIYKGKVVNIEPSIQAAFVDIGEGRNGFLHVSDVMPIYGHMNSNHNSHNRNNRHRNNHRRKREKKIQDLLSKNAEVLVQITKEGIGTKAPTLTTYLSLPGRYIVLMPSIKRSGVSRKIVDEKARKRLKKTLTELEPPKGMGYIIRTAGSDKTKNELGRDLNYLLDLWKVITRRAKHSTSPATIYQESDLVTRTLRDIFTDDIEEIIVDSEDDYQKALDFMSLLSPDYEERVQLYSSNTPLFHEYRIEAEIEKIYKKHVPLKSGGHLAIEQTEALVAIDVNSGKYTGEEDIEETALQINLEAAVEIPRQLRLRDLGGVIINDFIDMKDEKNKEIVERVFRDEVRKDRARNRVAKISPFGIIEMTRQRLGPSLKSYTHNVCPYCDGHGWIKNLESMSLLIMRKIKLGALSGNICKIIATMNPEVALDLANRKRKALHELEEKTGISIMINPCDSFSIENSKVEYFNRTGLPIQL